MSSGTVDEAADRVLTAIARKLDRELSTEFFFLTHVQVGAHISRTMVNLVIALFETVIKHPFIYLLFPTLPSPITNVNSF
jgi:hypothetical protein